MYGAFPCSTFLLYFCDVMKTIHYEIADRYEAIRPFVLSLPDKGVPADAGMVYDGPRNKVYCVALSPDVAEATGLEAVNVKAYRIPHAVNRMVYGNFRNSKARRAYYNALELEKLGFRTACPVAYVEESSFRVFGRSYFVSEQLSADWVMLRNAHEWSDLDEVAEALARFILRLHNAGVWMKDFSPGNVLMRRGDDGIEFALVDINRMEFGVKKREKLMTNFQCIFDTPDPAAAMLLARKFAGIQGFSPGSAEYDRILAEVSAVVDAYQRRRRGKRQIKRLIGKK